MNKLLNAGFSRLRRDRVFWISMAVMGAYAVFCCLLYLKYREETPFDTIFFYGYGLEGLITVPGIVMAVFCSLFTGTEYSDGTIRNKLIVGRKRMEIYFSNFIVCAAAGIIFNLVFSGIAGVIGIPLYGGFQLPMINVLQTLVTGFLIMISYAALFNMLGMLLCNKTTASVLCMIAVITVMCTSAYIIMMLGQKEMTEIYSLTANGEWVPELGPNPNYVSGIKREIMTFFVNLFPTGQGLQLSGHSVPSVWPLPIYSLGLIAAASGIGAFIFNKRDLK